MEKQESNRVCVSEVKIKRAVKGQELGRKQANERVSEGGREEGCKPFSDRVSRGSRKRAGE